MINLFDKINNRLIHLRNSRLQSKIFRDESLEDYQKWDVLKLLNEIYRIFPKPRSISCLDIGSSACEANTLSRYVKKVTGINISENYLDTSVRRKNVELLIMDGTDLSFSDNSFDLVYSINLLEHIHNMGRCIDEQLRVVKPGGFCYASWYPVWSGSKGHHVMDDIVTEWEKILGIEKQGYQDNGTQIKDWSHLYLTKEQMTESLNEIDMNNRLVDQIVDFIYHSEELNRLFFDQIMEIFKGKTIRIHKLIKQEEPVPENVLNRLKSIYPYKDFSTTGCQVVFSKI